MVQALSMFARAAETFRRVGDAADAAERDVQRGGHPGPPGALRLGGTAPGGGAARRRSIGDEELVALVLRGRVAVVAATVTWPVVSRCSMMRDAFRRTGRAARGRRHRHCDGGGAPARRPDLRGACARRQRHRVCRLHRRGDLAPVGTPGAGRSTARRRSSSAPPRHRWTRASGSAPLQRSRHERGFLLVVAARLARRTEHAEARQLDEEAQAALDMLESSGCRCRLRSPESGVAGPRVEVEQDLGEQVPALSRLLSRVSQQTCCVVPSCPSSDTAALLERTWFVRSTITGYDVTPPPGRGSCRT